MLYMIRLSKRFTAIEKCLEFKRIEIECKKFEKRKIAENKKIKGGI